MTWTLAVALLGDPLPGRSPPELRVPINAAASRLRLPLGHPVLGTLRADPGDTHEAGSQASSAGDVDPFRIGALGHGARVARLTWCKRECRSSPKIAPSTNGTIERGRPGRCRP